MTKFIARVARGRFGRLPEGVKEEKLREAAEKRLRPILMSAMIAVLMLAPLALGVGRGAGLQRPLATASIFGLTAAVPLVLLFLPALIAMLTRRGSSVGLADAS